MEYTHKCIKCTAEYKDTDPDPYYCAPCNEIRLQVAKEVDAKQAMRVSKRPAMSDLQIFNELAKKGGKNNVHVSIKDLGITL